MLYLLRMENHSLLVCFDEVTQPETRVLSNGVSVAFPLAAILDAVVEHGIVKRSRVLRSLSESKGKQRTGLHDWFRGSGREHLKKPPSSLQSLG
jgi:hypothetical protein